MKALITILQEKALKLILEIVNGFKTFGRKSTGTTEDINVHNVIKDTLVLVENIYKRQKVYLKTNFKAQQAIVKGEYIKIQQILINLFSK